MLKRALPMPTVRSALTQVPSWSGPRWRNARVAAASRSGATGTAFDSMPTMPHMISVSGSLRRSRPRAAGLGERQAVCRGGRAHLLVQARRDLAAVASEIEAEQPQVVAQEREVGRHHVTDHQ